MDHGFYFEETEGLFSKMAYEGLWDDLDHWIGDGWLRLKEREKEKVADRNSSRRGGRPLSVMELHWNINSGHGLQWEGHE